MGQWERVGHHHRFQAEMGLAYIRLPEDKQKQLVTDGGNINVEVNTQKTNKSQSKVIQ